MTPNFPALALFGATVAAVEVDGSPPGSSAAFECSVQGSGFGVRGSEVRGLTFFHKP
jgi:hypothetical protein